MRRVKVKSVTLHDGTFHKLMGELPKTLPPGTRAHWPIEMEYGLCPLELDAGIYLVNTTTKAEAFIPLTNVKIIDFEKDKTVVKLHERPKQ